MCAHLQALQLLGKLGGRNRRFLAEPLELELKDNPEHGLRLILTFQPQTSFLVPLDRCLALSSHALLSPTSARFPLPAPPTLAGTLPAPCRGCHWVVVAVSSATLERTYPCCHAVRFCMLMLQCELTVRACAGLAPAGKQSVHEKRQALRFLHICLASVLNLRSPDDSQLPGAPMDKLAAMLFGNQVPRRAPSLPPPRKFKNSDCCCSFIGAIPHLTLV
jgi:hypothetical protein